MLHHTYEYQPSMDLEWDVRAPSIGTEGPLIFFHGGSKRNWQSLCKAFH